MDYLTGNEVTPPLPEMPTDNFLKRINTYDNLLLEVRGPTSSWGPFGPFAFVFCALWAVKPYDPHTPSIMKSKNIQEISKLGGQIYC